VELLLVAVGIGLTAYLRIAGVLPSMAMLFILVIAWTVLGLLLFFLLNI